MENDETGYDLSLFALHLAAGKLKRRLQTWPASVQIIQEEFENGGFILKMHQIIFVHTTSEEF